MVRHFVLGNGNILVGLDSNGHLRDFYFPFVGQENHVGGRIHKMGIWADGEFSWFDSKDWKKDLSYKKEVLVSHITSVNERLGLEVEMNCAVCHNKDIYIRKLTVRNTSSKKREIRLFFHQHFVISRANIGDTAYYDPTQHALIHYKGRRYFLANACVGRNAKKGFTSYATGLVEEFGLEGSYKDAEDGVLSENPIEHGSVDSTLSLNFNIPPKCSQECYYWIAAGKKFGSVHSLNESVLRHGPEKLLNATEAHWTDWVNKGRFEFHALSPRVIDLFKRSLLLITTHVDNRGAIIASSDSDILFRRKDTYNYMWPRDGALISRSLDRAGYVNITSRFFKFCSESITDEGYFFHKYNPDGSVGSTWHPWLEDGRIQLPIQEDEIALVIDALWKHYFHHGNTEFIKRLFEPFIRKSADFMTRFIDLKTCLPKESYGLWEEKLGIHTFTCSTTYAGLRAAANFERVFGTQTRAKRYLREAERIRENTVKKLYDSKAGYFIKGLYYDHDRLKKDMTLDVSSFYGIFEYGLLPVTDERVTSTFNEVRKRLWCNTAIGGLARYEDDNYHRVDRDTPGNPWLITTLWLAEYYIKLATNEEELRPAIEIFEWVADNALDTGVLPEQLDPHTGEPLSVAPLTWSHAGFAIAINKYLQKLDELKLYQHKEKQDRVKITGK